MQMRDSEVVAYIVAGDPDGLAAAYDRYAEPLYKYCRSVLSDPADTADAVQDTFVIAASRLAGLRDPDRLRAWLYAVARNECLRILRSRRPSPASARTAPGLADTVIDITEGAAERAELRVLLAAAARGLDPGEREVLELQLRQGLEPAEAARVLGMSRNQAHSLASRAREQLEACLAVLLVGRAGRGDCGALNGMLADWHGQLTPVLRKRVHRHIERCATCATRRVYELRPAVLLGLSPGAAMAAAAAESFRLAPGVPPGLKAHTLALAAGQDPGAVAHHAAALGRAATFGREGFPEPLRHPRAKAGLRSSPWAQASVAAAVVAAVAAAVAAFALSGNAEHLTLASGKSPAAAAPHTLRAADPATSSAGREPSSPAAASTPAGQRPSPHKRSSATAGRPATPATPTASSPASGAPAPTTTSPAPAASTTSPAAVQASLSVSVLGSVVPLQPGTQLTVGRGGTWLTLKANGGPVSWSITASSGIIVWPEESGTLTTAGASTSVWIVAFGMTAGATLTINPGGASYPLVTSPRF
jgi:RNA polymerase sigma factor (sigma-70 family)